MPFSRVDRPTLDVCQPCQETKSDHRWSEVIPPDSGLTFAVIWDPEDGLIAFTGAELLDSSANYANSPTSPSEAFDNRSQVLTLGTLSSTNMLTETPTTLAFFRDTHQHLFAGSRGRHDPSKRIRHGARTQTSSTIGGVDVYLRGSLLGKVHKDQGHYSCFDLLEQEFEVKPLSDRRFMSEDAESLELRYNRAFSFFRMEQNISSRFSTTTTSTSSYVTIAPNVGDEDFASKNWSMLERPNTPVFSRSTKIPHSHFDNRHCKALSFGGSQRLRRRLRRTYNDQDMPASPAEVLRRAEYNHETTFNESGRQRTTLPGTLLKGLSTRWRRGPSHTL